MMNLTSDLTSRAAVCREGIQEIEFRRGQIKDLEREREALHRNRLEIAKEADMHQKALVVMEELVKLVSEQDLNVLAGMIDWGLKLVFDDRSYRAVITATRERNNPSVDFQLARTIHGHEVVADVWEDIGGGVRAVIGLIIQVFYIKFTGMKRVLFLDEALSAISDQYVEGLFCLLRALVDRMGFKFLLITHDERFLRMVDRHYYVQSGVYCLRSR